MRTASVVYPRPRARTSVDHASIALLRAVMSDAWRAEEAAGDLLVLVRGNRRLLELMRAKVSRAALDRPTQITERAAATLDRALTRAVDPADRGVVLPRQEVAHA